MRSLQQTYQVSLIRTLFICLTNIIFFLFALFLSCVIVYTAITQENVSIEGKVVPMLFVLFLILYVGLYPLIIYWNYYQHDKHVILIIDNERKEIIYKNKTIIKKIKLEDIVRLEQYCSGNRILFMEYYKIILREGSPIIITYLINTQLWKLFDNISIKRIPKNYLWLLKREV